MDFDPHEQGHVAAGQGAVPTFFSTYFGHPTIPRRLSRVTTANSRARFAHAIRDCTLRYVPPTEIVIYQVPWLFIGIRWSLGRADP
jgi:hypothetical protein